MSNRRGALWGVGFAVFFSLALGLLVAQGEPDDTEQAVASWYDSHGDDLFTSGVLVGVACFCLLCFLGSLRGTLRRGENGDDRLSALAFGAGLVMAALLFAFGGAISAVGTAAEWNGTDDPFRADIAASEPFWILGWWFMTYASMAGGVLAGATALLAWRARVFPRWYAVVSALVAVAGFVAVATWGLVIVGIIGWAVLTSIVMLVRPFEISEGSVTAAA